MTTNKERQRIATRWGAIVVQLQEGKITGCTLPYVDNTPAAPFAVTSRSSTAVAAFIRDSFRGLRAAVPPVGELQGSSFQRRVWDALREIPSGETRSYREIAEAVGNPLACRAVANACGKNPAPLFIPCHRVIGSDGRMHGFSAGRAWKKLLLAVENRGAIKQERNLHHPYR